MSQVVCPLCGKSSTRQKFQPSSQHSDIYVQDMRSLGRAKGFRPENRRSALDDLEIVEPIANRCLDLIDLLFMKKKIPLGELKERPFLKALTKVEKDARPLEPSAEMMAPPPNSKPVPQVILQRPWRAEERPPTPKSILKDLKEIIEEYGPPRTPIDLDNRKVILEKLTDGEVEKLVEIIRHRPDQELPLYVLQQDAAIFRERTKRIRESMRFDSSNLLNRIEFLVRKKFEILFDYLKENSHNEVEARIIARCVGILNNDDARFLDLSKEFVAELIVERNQNNLKDNATLSDLLKELSILLSVVE